MILSKIDFAKFTGYSSRQIGLWLDDGLPTAPGDTGGRGKSRQIDTAKAVRWLLTRAAGNLDTGEMQQSKRSLIDARASKTNLEVRRMEGELLDRESVQVMVNELVAVLVTGLTSMPGRVVAALAGSSYQPAEIREATRLEVNAVRSEMSGKLAAFAETAGHDPMQAPDAKPTRKKATTRRKRRSVGKRKKVTTTRKRRAR